MNIYAVIILITLVGEYVLDVISDLLNLRTLHQELPEEFAGLYSEESYRKSQEYLRARTLFGIFSATTSLAVMLAFWFLGGFNWLDQIVRGWNLGEIWTGVAYVAVLMLARSLFSLPFSIYSTFVIEERFGFNKATPVVFVADLMKGMLLVIVIGGPVLVGVLALFMYAGPLAWLYTWIAGTLFLLLIQFIAPTWIMPLFNKFTPLAEGELRESILSYARSVNFALSDIYVMDGSKRSTKSNAFFTGFGRNKRIALFDTLIHQHSVPELVAILAHEIGHYKKRHIIQGMAISIVHLGVMLGVLSLVLQERGLYNAFFMEHQSVYAGMIFFGMLYAPVEFFLSLILHWISRRNEFSADRFAAETVARPAAMVDALKRLSVDNLSHLTPHPLYVKLHYSHPPVIERIRALHRLQSAPR